VSFNIPAWPQEHDSMSLSAIFYRKHENRAAVNSLKPNAPVSDSKPMSSRERSRPFRHGE